MHGSLVCAQHGGLLPPVKQAAAKRIAEASVRREISSMRDIPPLTGIGDVYAELLEIAASNRQWRLLLQERVSYLDSLGKSSKYTGEQIKADVQLFERALERSAKVGEMLARLNLDERKQALDEKTASQLGIVIQQILNDLDLTDEQRARAAVVAPARVRELTG